MKKRRFTNERIFKKSIPSERTKTLRHCPLGARHSRRLRARIPAVFVAFATCVWSECRMPLHADLFGIYAPGDSYTRRF